MAKKSMIAEEAKAEGESVAEEKKEHTRRRSGGSAPEGAERKAQIYNAQGSAAMDSAKDETPGFKKGGHKKRMAGGMAEGDMAGERLDRRPRRAAGGRTPGGSPYSSASAMVGPENGNRGFEGTPRKP